VSCLLTGYSVDGFERSEYTHCSDGGEVDVLEIKGVFHHPEKYKHTENYCHSVNKLSVVSASVVVETGSLKTKTRGRSRRLCPNVQVHDKTKKTMKMWNLTLIWT